MQDLGRLVLPVAADPDDPVGREAGAGVGDGVEERGAAGSGGAGEAYGAAAAEEAYEAVAFLDARAGRSGGQGRAGQDGRSRGGVPAARAAAPRRVGRSVRRSLPGRRGSISLPSTGLTVRENSPAVSVTIRAGAPAPGDRLAPAVGPPGASAGRPVVGRSP
ncbi:hypothetical protein [Streptomyces sp. RerS4]|uniref:hypothetical protein n=1 Tax=Streptomyces sp. RerS4 TaxID=2942449 RepID=UPI00201C8899|nr:hypothetical protein [Streptomyces sp. RerS4]UQX03022.1 hypothetical protein M4D82_22910 [Streptomyces sp. RerS4]